ncbi:MAG: molybdopterin-dependent oxidoreductase [Verrucomicrobia bacterium]|nr:molybdopterin-dependent oxidoreductase [Verrucomicrobiota bacterium]
MNLGRRQFLRSLLLAGAPAAASVAGEEAQAAVAGAILRTTRPDRNLDLNNPRNFLYSACMQCNTGCGIKVKIQDGEVAKIDGNPYNPWCVVPHLPMKTAVPDAARLDGALCPKGQAGLQTHYDPYRIARVLKRAGPRGDGRWVTIPFDQAITEIVEGGKLFSQVPGEENRVVEGLRSIMALRDDAVAKAMAADIAALWDEKDAEKKKALAEAFRQKHAAHLDKLIDPAHPDFGPKNNQFIVSWGRLKGGRSDFIKRFGAGYGTTNLHGHTTVCQGSLYFTCKAISEQYLADKFSGGEKFYWQTDLEHARYVLFVGANLFDANYGPTNRTVRLTDNLASGRTHIAVADPRFTKLAAKAGVWLPLKPGTDAALAMAIIRRLIETGKIDQKFLAAANKAAATAAGELSWTNASWLVEIKNGTPGKFVRGADAGVVAAEKRTLPDPKDPKKTLEYEEKFLLVLQNGQPVAFDPNDKTNAVAGELFVDAALPNGTKVKSSLQILKEEAFAKTIAEWCEIAGVRTKDVLKVADALGAHGKQASVDIHRGPAQHTNGFYNVLSWMAINMLLGNYDWAGGMSKATTFGYDGSKGGPFDLNRVPGKLTAFGISSIRHDLAYEKTTLFAGYPAKRNWFPLSSDIYEEVLPSIEDAYPYPMKAMFTYMGASAYSLPAGHTNIPVLADVRKLPLLIASDITVGVNSRYADYIFPDTDYLERWEFQGSHPNMACKVAPIRQPVAKPLPEIVTVFGQAQPICLESTLMAIAEKLGLKCFGPNAFAEGQPCSHPDDYYLRAVANVAAGEAPDGSKAVPDASAEEIEIFRQSRRHLPPAVFDLARWQKIVGEKLWPKVVYVLNRGGRYEDHAKGFNGKKLANAYGKLLNLYQEKTAGVIHAGTGKKHFGTARYLPIADYTGQAPDAYRQNHPLQLITHRTIAQTKSRTCTNYWLLPLMPENGLVLHPHDAAAHGLSHGDEVRVVSATNPAGVWDLGRGGKKEMLGKVIVSEGIRPGVISFALGFANWATGVADVTVDGKLIAGDARRGRGIHANAAMWTDPTIKNTCMFDPVGGSVSFYDSHVQLVKTGRRASHAESVALRAL